MSKSRVIAFMVVIFVTVVIMIASCQQSVYYGQDITPELYPDNSAVVLSKSRTHECEFVLELERTFVWGVVEYTNIEEHTKIKILTESGLEKFGNMASNVLRKENTEYEVEARVISPDGSVSKVSDDDITRLDIGKHYEQYRIAFPGLRVGSVIDMKERIKSQYGDMAGRWDFASEVPTSRSELVFKVPAGSRVRFNYKPPKEDEGEVVPAVEGKCDVYSFVMENVPPYKDEKLMSADHIGNPSLRYYTYHIPNETMEKALGIEAGSFRGQPYYMTWHNIAKIYGNYYEHQCWESDEDCDEYREARDEFIGEFKSGTYEDIEDMLGAFVSEFRENFQSIEGGYFLRHTNPEETYITREGNSFEAAYVMREMLRELGVAASIALVRDLSVGLLDRKMPGLHAFTDAILNIEHGGKEYWIDPGTHVCRLDQIPWQCRGIDGLWLLPDGDFVFKKIPMEDAECNRFANIEEVEFTADGDMNGSARVTITGQHLIGLREAIDADEEDRFREELVELFKNRYPVDFAEEDLAVVEKSDDSLVVTYRYHMPGYADMAGDFMNVDFSKWIGSGYMDLFEDEERLYDVNFPFLRCDRACVRVKVPDGMKVVELPKNASRRNDCFDYTRTIEVDGDVVTFSRRITLKNSTITADEYAAIKEFVEEIYRLDRETMVLGPASM